jgi:hypothetical protein
MPVNSSRLRITRPYQYFTDDSRCSRPLVAHLGRMSLADVYRDNAEDCAFLAQRSEDEDTRLALRRMEAAWRTLANQQERLDKKARTKKLSG